jgi:O-antigen/teichoic acid export membrane protein
LANFGGQAAAAVLNVILVPFYIKILGIEAYGLIGFFISLQAIISIFDFGLGATTTREIAKRAQGDILEKKEIYQILGTLEFVYVGIGICIALLIFFLANFIASKWINPGKFPVETIRFAIIIFGLIMAFRWPIALYTGALSGLEFQVIINIISLIVMLFRSIGIIIILIIISNTLNAFFIWQLITSIIELFLFYFVTWHKVPYKENNKYFDINVLKSLWQFSMKISLISICAAILKQLDKLLIVKLFPLQQVGYYYTATALVSGIFLFSSPITTAVFPRFSALYGQNKWSELSETYHSSAQFLSLLVACFSAAMFYFSYDILFLWTHSKEVAENAYPILSLLSIATLFNTIMHVPYTLQFAAGLMWLPLWNNFIAVLLLAPIIYILMTSVGIIGGAISWLLYNLINFSVVPRIMHRYILLNQFNKWFYNDSLQFIIISNLIFGIGYLIKYIFSLNLLITFIIIPICFILYSLVCFKQNKEINNFVTIHIFHKFNLILK